MLEVQVRAAAVPCGPLQPPQDLGEGPLRLIGDLCPCFYWLFRSFFVHHHDLAIAPWRAGSVRPTLL